jgi:hypothetical protein
MNSDIPARGVSPATKEQDQLAADRRAELNRRLRAEFVEGAEEDSRRRLGRGLTREELERVLRRYPGDVGRSNG